MLLAECYGSWNEKDGRIVVRENVERAQRSVRVTKRDHRTGKRQCRDSSMVSKQERGEVGRTSCCRATAER